MNLLTILIRLHDSKRGSLTFMPLTTDIGAKQSQIKKFLMILSLIDLLDFETIMDQILDSPFIPWFFARSIRISST